jgi:hypothetical protein
MKIPSDLKIREEQNLYHDNILDLWGNQFNFSHEKGLAEWLKNSFDAYLRADYQDKDKVVVLRFTDLRGDNPPAIECIDFIGMRHDEIQSAFMWWGDPNAAKRGMQIKTFGGHGNGGKFYMRQMFTTSHFITYKEGKVNIFGFTDKKKYGFVEGFEDKTTSLEDALALADLPESLIPIEFLQLIKAGKTGFTVVRGVKPKKIVGNRLPVGSICEKLKYHSQARRPLKYYKVSVVHNGKLIIPVLRMEDIEPMQEFEGPFVYDIPESFEVDNGKHGKETIIMANEKFKRGKLVLKTSAAPFGGRGGKRLELNCIDIIGEGVIASYHMREIGFIKYYPQAQCIYGECTCEILEDPESDCVQNDREKLVENDMTKSLREWITARIDELAEKIAAKSHQEEEKKNIETTDEFNKLLNKWKDQFMDKMFAEILGGPGRGASTGGLGDDGSGGGDKDKSEDKGGTNTGDGKGGGEGDQKKKGPRRPLVLLSGQEDPEVPGIPVRFSERHAPVEQRQQDVDRGIYWINLEKPIAKMVIGKYGRESSQWRNYLFERYVDIFTKETIYRAAKKEGGTLTPEVVDHEIDTVASLVYDKAAVDLENFLLEDKFAPEPAPDK